MRGGLSDRLGVLLRLDFVKINNVAKMKHKVEINLFKLIKTIINVKKVVLCFKHV